MTRVWSSIICLCLISISANSNAAPGDYTITNRMEILCPIDLGEINNGFQTVSIVSQTASTVTIDITYHPFFKPPPLQPSYNWQVDDRSMTEYLQPTITANWDADFRSQLLKDLATAGINPNELSDVDTVKQVSTWLVKNFSGRAPFIAYFVKFQNGLPVVPKEARAAFDREKKLSGIQSDGEAFQRGLFGKGIYQYHSAASCTPSAILWTTVFRALGIPTRIIVNIPAVDPNAPSQRALAEKGIHDARTNRTVIAGFSALTSEGTAFEAHTFNEVFVGGRWARLNYNQLDQPIVDRYYMGLLTQVKQMKDWSDSGLVATWGTRYAMAETDESQSILPRLSSINPYRSLKISDNYSESTFLTEHLPAR